MKELCLATLLLAPLHGVAHVKADVFFTQGLMVGEVTSSTAVVQVRVTKTGALVDGVAFDDGDALRDGDLPGVEASVRFSYRTVGSSEVQWTEPVEANASNDFIARVVLSGLKAGRGYQCSAAPVGAGAEPQVSASFHTLPGATVGAPVRFHVVTGMNYDKFYAPSGYRGEDRSMGYPACVAMAKLRPDFVVYTGDDVYYDKPPKTKSIADMRAKWHRQFSRPRMVALNGAAPGYWMKDDHDHRTNDSDAVGDYFPSHDLGLRLFREQAPIFAQDDDTSPTYRTHRVSKDLQIWMLEGRDYRSPNKMTDGPGKTIWGEEQLAWIKRTLLASDATYKLIISPTPLVGPDDGYKRDNHTNPKGFLHEGTGFKQWCAKEKLLETGTYFICGDRHWQYHSIESSGAQEFSSGAICDANSRIGRSPGDPKSTDPKGLIRQPYAQKRRSGGFLSVVCEPRVEERPAALRLEFYDEQGKELYSVTPPRH